MLEITWLGHSTFQLRLDTGEVFLMNPWTRRQTGKQSERH